MLTEGLESAAGDQAQIHYVALSQTSKRATYSDVQLQAIRHALLDADDEGHTDDQLYNKDAARKFHQPRQIISLTGHQHVDKKAGLNCLCTSARKHKACMSFSNNFLKSS